MSASLATDHIPGRLRGLMSSFAAAAADLSDFVSRGPLAGRMSAFVGSNADGDGQKELDVRADELFADALSGAGVRHYASEEQDDVLTLDPQGEFALAVDPLDGSSNIDTNVSIGTIFSVFDATGDPLASFLRPGREQIAGGYVIYGPQTAMVVTFGAGTLLYVLDRETRAFELAQARLEIPVWSNEYAINASNYRHWHAPVRAYVDDCLAGTEGPRQTNYNMRWIASLVAEAHRIVARGGIFLYPADARKGYRRGRLRHVYEAAPIAFLIEQAGGRATDGIDNILDLAPGELHQRVPLIFGSAEKVDRVAAYHDLPEAEVSALFSDRGLFRTSGGRT